MAKNYLAIPDSTAPPIQKVHLLLPKLISKKRCMAFAPKYSRGRDKGYVSHRLNYVLRNESYRFHVVYK